MSWNKHHKRLKTERTTVTGRCECGGRITVRGRGAPLTGRCRGRAALRGS